MIDLDEVSGSLFLAVQKAPSFLEASSSSLGGGREDVSAPSFLPCDLDGVSSPLQPSSVKAGGCSRWSWSPVYLWKSLISWLWKLECIQTCLAHPGECQKPPPQHVCKPWNTSVQKPQAEWMYGPLFWSLFLGDGERWEGFYLFCPSCVHTTLLGACIWVKANVLSFSRLVMNICVPGTGLGSDNIVKVKWVQFLVPGRTAGEIKHEMNMLKCVLNCSNSHGWLKHHVSSEMSQTHSGGGPGSRVPDRRGESGRALRMKRNLSWARCINRI